MLSPADMALFESMRATGVLVNTDAKTLNASNGVVVLACPEPTYTQDMMIRQSVLNKASGGRDRTSLVATPGGTISAVRVLRGQCIPDGTLLNVMWDTAFKRGVGTVVLYAHAPCRFHTGHEKTLRSLLATAACAWEYAIGARPKNLDVDVLCYMHFMFGAKMRTYEINMAASQAWLASFCRSD